MSDRRDVMKVLLKRAGGYQTLSPSTLQEIADEIMALLRGAPPVASNEEKKFQRLRKLWFGETRGSNGLDHDEHQWLTNELFRRYDSLIEKAPHTPTPKVILEERKLHIPIPIKVQDEAIEACMRVYGRTCSYIEGGEAYAKVIDDYRAKVLASDAAEPVTLTASDVTGEKAE
jgi:hypothetical protein